MQVNGSIVLSKLQVENDEYQITSSFEDIVRFYSKNELGEGVYETSPLQLRIEVYKNGIQQDFKGKYRFKCAIPEDLDLDFTEYLTFGEEVSSEEGIQKINENTLIFNINDMIKQNTTLQTNNCVFVFEYLNNEKTIASKPFQLRDGVSAEMAKFNITATNINASVDNSSFIFSKDGLTINDSGFQIKQDNKQVFGFESKIIDGNQTSKLTVHGAIYADEGQFSGEIHATNATFDSGIIGGFEISNKKLVSTKKIENGYEEDQTTPIYVPSIELDGDSGRIIARDIILGDNAVIDNQIKLGKSGEAYIYNPDKNGGQFIKSKDIVINNNGTAHFGTIYVDGINSELRGANWKIGNDYANFQNVNVSGAIETSVFKTGTTQAIGSSMIFRPSYKGVLDFDGKYAIVQLENEFMGAIGSTVEIISEDNSLQFNGKVDGSEGFKIKIELSKEEIYTGTYNVIVIDYGGENYSLAGSLFPIEGENYYYLESSFENDELVENYKLVENMEKHFQPLTINENNYLASLNLKDNDLYLYADETTNGNLLEKDKLLINTIKNLYVNKEDMLIGINSGRVTSGMGHVLPRGITLTSLSNNTNEPKVFLGDLSQLNQEGYVGYGLYSNNVYLTGSLVTEITDNGYAGINTLGDIKATKFDNDTSNIIFWAGAKQGLDNNMNIEDAPFQVTQNGSIYASRALLQDSLIVGGTLKATEIHTGKLRGQGSGLSIYDGSQGILFKGDEERTLFSIKTDGLQVENNGDPKYFISFDKNDPAKVTLSGDIIQTGQNNNYLCLTTETNESSVGMVGKTIPVLKHVEGSNSCGFYFDEISTKFKMNSKDIQEWKVDSTILYNKVMMSNNSQQMEYKPAKNGYDLYVIMGEKEE